MNKHSEDMVEYKSNKFLYLFYQDKPPYKPDANLLSLS